MDDEKAVAEEMRRKATEGLTVKRKRKAEEAESDKDDAGPSRGNAQRALVERAESRRRNEIWRSRKMSSSIKNSFMACCCSSNSKCIFLYVADAFAAALSVRNVASE